MEGPTGIIPASLRPGPASHARSVQCPSRQRDHPANATERPSQVTSRAARGTAATIANSPAQAKRALLAYS